MKRNVGGLDKTLRIILGCALIITGLFVEMSGGIKIAVFAAAAIALLTGIFGLCPLYMMLGISSCKECKADKERR